MSWPTGPHQPDDNDPPMARPEEKKATFGWMSRLLRYRLMIPIHRSNRDDPRPAARGVGVGLFLALTPTVGIQTIVAVALWGLVRWLRPAWHFNLIVACAWVWVTNVFTIPIVYYVFLVTGRIMMGADAPFGGFVEFTSRMEALLATDTDFLSALWVYTVEIFETWGIPLFLGSLPWAVAAGWLGYVWSLAFLRRLHARRETRMQAAAERHGIHRRPRKPFRKHSAHGD